MAQALPDRPHPLTPIADAAAGPGALAPGLCATCDHAGHCVFLARATAPVWSCEEFSAHGAGVQEHGPRAVLSMKGAPTAPSLGLCVNCLERGTCTLPNREGGIWHCEEYR